MRATAAIVIALALLATRATASSIAPTTELDFGDGDPKCARGECRPPRRRPIDEDDPKLARGIARARPVARFEASYRFFQLADPYGGALPFHLVELSGFPYAKIFRLGISLSAGGAPRYSAWLFDVGLSVGVQYPARVTPFLDLRLNVGVIGAEIVGRKVVSYQYRPTLEAGIEVFIAGRFHLTAAVGWAHPVYGGVDARLIEQQIAAGISPKYTVEDFSFDTLTTRVGLGF